MTVTVQQMLAAAEAAVVPRIMPEEAKGLVGSPDVVFLDVREPNEVAASGKVPARSPSRAGWWSRADPASALHDANRPRQDDRGLLRLGRGVRRWC